MGRGREGRERERERWGGEKDWDGREMGRGWGRREDRGSERERERGG